MTTLVFKTTDDAAHPVEILGVGSLGPNGKGGVSVEQAALWMSELQEKDEVGRVVLDEHNMAKPLTGKKLADAAKELADARGWKTASIADEKVATLPLEWGGAPDRPPAHEVAAASGEALRRELGLGTQPEDLPDAQEAQTQAAHVAAPNTGEEA